MSKPYTLTSPCADCPFRCDVNRYLSPERAQGIMNESYEDSNFYCHKTVDYSGENGEGEVVSKSRVCAGFLVTMENEGRANQPTRIAERLGLYDRGRMDMDAPTYPSMRDWVRSYLPEGDATGDDSDAPEHCGVVGPNCMDPAGYARGGAVFDNPEPPICTVYCASCESPVCGGCTSRTGTATDADEEHSGPVCIYCA